MDRATFEAVPESAGAARAFVRSCLAGHDVDLDVVLLLASELATNAIVHVGLAFEVWVDVSAPGVRVGVDDRSTVMPVRRQPDPRETTGRGLGMVRTQADGWGIDATPLGKRVWFKVCWRLNPL